ncbi:hypothetical protein ACFSO7_09100 [Bacillus sp. CGMCC 1.16607]
MENKFAVLIFFSLLSLIATTIFSSVIISQNKALQQNLKSYS